MQARLMRAYTRMYEHAEYVHTKPPTSVCSSHRPTCHRRGHLHHKRCFLAALEADMSEIKVLADSVPGQSSPPGSQPATFSLHPHAWEERGS